MPATSSTDVTFDTAIQWMRLERASMAIVPTDAACVIWDSPTRRIAAGSEMVPLYPARPTRGNSQSMLYEFITFNRAEIIDRCRAKVATRSIPPPSDAEINHGVPLFLDQLVEILQSGPGGVDLDK